MRFELHRVEPRLCRGCKKPIEGRSKQARYHFACKYTARMERLHTPEAKRKRELYRIEQALKEVPDDSQVPVPAVPAAPVVVAPPRRRPLSDLRGDVPGGERFSVSW